MDLHLPLLADINLHLGVAEEAVADEAWQTAQFHLDKAEESFAELRKIWPEMGKSEQGILSAITKPLRTRADALSKRIPRSHSISDSEPVHDPEQETEPELA